MGYERDMSEQHIPLVKPSTHRRFRRFTGYVVEIDSPLLMKGLGGSYPFHPSLWRGWGWLFPSFAYTQTIVRL